MHSLYTYTIVGKGANKAIVIEDLAVGPHATYYKTVTNNIQNVVAEISGEKKIDPAEFIIVYRDTEEYWDGWDALNDDFIILRCKTPENAIARSIEKLFPHQKSNKIMNESKSEEGAVAPHPSEQEFKEACRPLIKYLAENHHPHTKVLVTNINAELLEGIKHTGDILDYLNQSE